MYHHYTEALVSLFNNIVFRHFEWIYLRNFSTQYTQDYLSLHSIPTDRIKDIIALTYRDTTSDQNS